MVSASFEKKLNESKIAVILSVCADNSPVVLQALPIFLHFRVVCNILFSNTKLAVEGPKRRAMGLS